MKKKLTMKQLICLLLVISACLYILHYIIFRDLHHLAIFFLHELAFLPLEAIIVTLGLDGLIERTNEDARKSKLSIIETLFFNESGGNMLRYLISFDEHADRLRTVMDVCENWKDADFRQAQKGLKQYSFHLDVDKIDFFGLHYHLNERQDYYREILENPALTQSNEFTGMIMNIYLLWEELDCRTDLYQLASDEKAYLGKLIEEIYEELTSYWLDNAYNHSIHNRPRLHRLIENNPFK